MRGLIPRGRHTPAWRRLSRCSGSQRPRDFPLLPDAASNSESARPREAGADSRTADGQQRIGWFGLALSGPTPPTHAPGTRTPPVRHTVDTATRSPAAGSNQSATPPASAADAPSAMLGMHRMQRSSATLRPRHRRPTRTGPDDRAEAREKSIGAEHSRRSLLAGHAAAFSPLRVL